MHTENLHQWMTCYYIHAETEDEPRITCKTLRIEDILSELCLEKLRKGREEFEETAQKFLAENATEQQALGNRKRIINTLARPISNQKTVF